MRFPGALGPEAEEMEPVLRGFWSDFAAISGTTLFSDSGLLSTKSVRSVACKLLDDFLVTARDFYLFIFNLKFYFKTESYCVLLTRLALNL